MEDGPPEALYKRPDPASSSPPASFLILTDSGKEIISHKSYIKHEVLETDLDHGNVSAAGLVDHENLSAAGPDATVTPVEPNPSPTGQEITHSEHDSAKPVLDGAWEGRLRPRKA